MGEGGSIPKIKQYHFKICKSEVIIIKTIKINFKFQMLNFSLSPEQIMIVHLNANDKDSLINYYAENYKSSNVIVPEISEEYLLYEY